MSERKVRVVKAPKSPKQAKPELSVHAFASPAKFAAWLAKHHSVSPGIWLKIAKKGAGVASVTYAEALEVALAWGWIDGQIQAIDEQFFQRKFTPRGPRSIWSKINREKALALIAAGEMHPPGLAEVERAQKDGRFRDAYDAPSQAKPPPDFAAALGRSARAKAFYAKLEARNRYAILFRVQTAKRPETRARRITEIIAMLERGEKFHP